MLRLLFLLFPFLLAAQVIPTTEFSIQTTRGQSTAEQSFDGNENTSFFGGWTEQNAECVLTFDVPYQLSKIRYLDGSGRPNLAFYANDDTEAFKIIPLQQYLVWGEEKVDVTVKTLRIQIQGLQGDKAVPEIILYGKKAGTTTTPPPVPPTAPTNLTGMGARIGTCAFQWVPLDRFSGKFSKVRDFMVSDWTWTPNGFSPQPLAGAISDNVLGYDDYFAEAKAKGVDIIPCINQTPAWFIGQPNQSVLSYVSEADGSSIEYYNPKLGLANFLEQGPEVPAMYSEGYDPDVLPRKPGSDPQNPAAYTDWAKFMFQWGARYGTKAWPDEMLKVNEIPPFPNYPHNEKKTGLGLLKYIEPGNEPIKFWKPQLGITPEQVAAMLSAVYDGHNGTLGKGVGLYGCGIKVVLPGLTSANLDEYKRIVAWSIANRPDKTLPFDIVNFHWYSNTGNEAGRWPPNWTAGTPADNDKAWSDVEKFVAYVKSTGKEVWCTEFGYDSRGPSWQWAVPYGNYTSEHLQADWLVRTYLMMFRAGVDECFVFNGINEPGAVNGGLYQNSGLMYGRGEPVPYSPKPSYNAVVNLSKSLQGYTYTGDVSPGDNVIMLRFQKGNQTLVWTWCATVNGTTRQVKLNGKTYTVTETPQAIEMKPGRLVSTKTGPIRKFILKTSPRLIKPKS